MVPAHYGCGYLVEGFFQEALAPFFQGAQGHGQRLPFWQPIGHRGPAVRFARFRHDDLSGRQRMTRLPSILAVAAISRRFISSSRIMDKFASGKWFDWHSTF